MKKAVSATIEDDLIKWIDEMIKDKERFRNRSHLIEIALAKMKKEEK
ncbi:MAG: ribbon-helix-helix protein, CopG family [Candidatus Woesearchaeota archaeon]|jgi:Arc/MetJ-type ribon-helix-helix transcriptional regulator|nr:ribbon-helix-helix protein, CopG family [Candidatus Woesearchaeota archaeon]MDP7323326.1 ribbon-helix-helix protein, CopG family [Candidatus Woesearchaeota archaeon]MDP7458510.1 ribbon-helix-helix protein, CopG family [Candidatus Woesearchaeota archaeon]|tara:strand:- start:305 stop:445 length:141 start_codon:yes stop_codon:yes gene_type:complete